MMMKNIGKCILIMGLTLSMTGCQSLSNTNKNQMAAAAQSSVSSSDLQAQKQAAQAYMEAMKQGDLQTALSYCTDDFEDGFKIKTLNDKINELLQKYNLSDSYSAQASEIVSSAAQNVFKKYTFDDDSESVEATVEAIDVDEVENSIKSYTNEYIEKNSSSMISDFMSGGKDAVIQKIAPDLVNYIQEKAEDEINHLQYKKMKVKFSFEKVDGSWKISKTEKVSA